MTYPLSPLAKAIFKIINIVPWIFPKRHRWVAKHYLFERVGRTRESDTRLIKGSLLAGDFTWKGISVLIPFDHKQLSTVTKWMEKRRTAMASSVPYSPPHRASSMLGFQCFHLGFIPFNTFSDFYGAPIFLKSLYPKFCDVNTMYLPNGAAYLSLYIRLDDVATETVKDVDVTHVRGEKVFLSLNPFNKSFGILSDGVKESSIEKLVRKRSAQVMSESLEVVDVLLRLWGKRLKSERYNVVADFVSHSWEATGYFSPERPNIEKGDTHVLIDPRRQYLITGRSSDLTGVMMERDDAESFGADAIFIKAEARATEPDYGFGYLSGLHYGIEEYAGIQYVIDVEKRLITSAAKISEVFTKARISSRKSLSILVAQSLSLNLIDERIDALKNSDRWFDGDYKEVFERRVSSLEEKFSNLRGKIQKRRDQAHDEVQLAQLHWTKRNAWLLVALALVQIGIALVVVDWTESGIDKNNIFLNWNFLVSYFIER